MTDAPRSKAIVRQAEAQDLEVVAGLRLKFLAAHRGVGVASFPADFVQQTRAFLLRHAAADSICSWLAETDGELTGGVSMLILDLAPRPEDNSGREGYIINMYVDPAYRRRGIGRSLLEACVRAANDLGLRRLLLSATEDGRPLYDAAGFRTNPNWMELPR